MNDRLKIAYVLSAMAYYSQRHTWVALQLVNAMKENIQCVSDCQRIKRNIEQKIHIRKQNAVSARCVSVNTHN